MELFWIFKPGGSSPRKIDHSYGRRPRTADKYHRYGSPGVAAGGTTFSICGSIWSGTPPGESLDTV